MSYLVLVPFDLKDASWDDYEAVYKELEKIGLSKRLISNEGKEVLLPTTTVAGKFEGDSSVDVRDNIMDKCKRIFKNLKLRGEIFVGVGDNWSWSHSEI